MDNQLGCALNQVNNYSKFDIIMSGLTYIFGRISTSIGDQQRSKVANLAKYGHLQEVGTFPIIISVTKYELFYTKTVIIYLNEYQLCFFKTILEKS